MKDRLLKILKHYNLTSTRFADEIGVQRSGISHILSGRNQPSYDFIVKMMKQYPEINPDWLIMGQGNMFRISSKDKITIDPELFDQNEIKNKPQKDFEPSVAPDDKKQLKITKVTNIQQIVIFYPDGTFKPYVPLSIE